MAHGTKPDPNTVPPVGLAPEGQDFAHPYVISAIVSILCFGVGFLALWLTGLWAKLPQWADAPFMIYFAILLPVLAGFMLYGIFHTVAKLTGKRAK